MELELGEKHSIGKVPSGRGASRFNDVTSQVERDDLGLNGLCMSACNISTSLPRSLCVADNKGPIRCLRRRIIEAALHE